MAPVGGLASHYFPREAPYVRMIYSIDEIHGGVGGYAPPVAPILPLPSLHPRFPTRYPRPIRSLPQSKPALYKHSKTHLSPATLPSTLYQRLLVPLSATTRAYRAWFTILTPSPSYHRYCTAAKPYSKSLLISDSAVYPSLHGQNVKPLPPTTAHLPSIPPTLF